MKINLKRWLIYTVLVLIVFIGILYNFSIRLKNKHKVKLDTVQSFMTNVHATAYDKLGHVKDVLVSPRVTHLYKDNTTLADHPYVTATAKSGPPWQIHAEHGKLLNGKEEVQLWGNVNITQPAGIGSQNTTLLTSKITYYPQRKFAETDQPVTIMQPGTVIHGIGMTADLNKGLINILHHTQGQYDPKVAKKAKQHA